MSIVVKSDNKIIWEPSLRVGQLFTLQTQVIEEIFGLSSGISPIVSDDVTIDSSKLAEFILVLLQKIDKSNNKFFAALLSGYLGTAIFLLRQSGADSTIENVQVDLVATALDSLSQSQTLRPYN